MLLLSINQFLIIQGGIFMKKTLSLILILSMFLCSNLSVFAMETTSTTSSTCNIYNDVESSGARIVHNYKNNNKSLQISFFHSRFYQLFRI